MEDLRARGRRPATISAYCSDWQKLARWSARTNGEPFDLTRLVAREAAEFRAAQSANEHKAATINRSLAFLLEYARWAGERGDIRAGLARALQRLPRVMQQQLAPRGLTRVELRRLLKEVDVRASVRDRAVVYLLLYSGLRLGETTQLRVEDIELSERRGIVRITGEFAKGGKGRTVPIPPQARKALRDYLDVRGDAPGRLFIGERGPLGRNGISGLVARFGAAAGVKVTPHTLRHSFAFRFLAVSNNDLVGLADLMGHSNVNTTRHYARRRLEDLERALEGMDF